MATQLIGWRRAILNAFAEVPFSDGQRFSSIEIQHVDVGGQTGLLVKTQRPTGELDMAIPPEFDLDEEWFRTDPFMAHMNLGSIEHATFHRSDFSVSPLSVDVDIDVETSSGTRIRATIAHRFRRKTAPLFVPAVRQQGTPLTLRFMSAEYMRLLPRWAKKVSVTVDGVALKPQPFLLPSLIAPFYSARYGGGILGAGLNESGEQIQLRDGTRKAPDQVEVASDGQYFTAAFHQLEQGAKAGDFVVESPVGVVAVGRWSLEGTDQQPILSLDDVSQDWHPGWRSPTRIPLYFIRRLRRRHERWQWNVAASEPTLDTQMNGRWSTN